MNEEGGYDAVFDLLKQYDLYHLVAPIEDLLNKNPSLPCKSSCNFFSFLFALAARFFVMCVFINCLTICINNSTFISHSFLIASMSLTDFIVNVLENTGLFQKLIPWRRYQEHVRRYVDLNYKLAQVPQEVVTEEVQKP